MSARTPVLVRFPPALLARVDEARGPLNRHAFLIDVIERAVTQRSQSDTPERTVPQATPDAGESKTAPSVDSSAAAEGGMPAADLDETGTPVPPEGALDGTPPVHEGSLDLDEIRDSDGVDLHPVAVADEASAVFERAPADLGGGSEGPIGLASPDLDIGLDDLPGSLTDDAFDLDGLDVPELD